MARKSLTKMEEERRKKRLLAETEEILEATGQESEKKSVKWVQEAQKIEEGKEKKREERFLEELDLKKKQVYSYKQMLQQILHDKIIEIEMPPTYEWGVWFDGKGIRVFVKDKDGVRKDRAFRVTNDPKFDLHAVYMFSLWVEDIYDACESKNKVTNQIWTPKNVNEN